VEAQGFKGGIWVLWNSHELDAKIITSHDQFVTIEITPPNRRSWLLTIVYANPHGPLREALWQELAQCATDFRKPWLLAGDFNETAYLEERNHGSPEMLRRCNRFKQLIENNGLIDLGFFGPNFTWTRGLNQENRKEARLDRALCNMEWRGRFQEAAVRHLIRACSDHSPLLIAIDGFAHATPSRKPFRFLAAWMSHNQFEDFVRGKWSPHSSLIRNLSNLAAELTTWNREVFGNLFRKKRSLWARIEGIQLKLEAGAPRFLLKLEKKLRQELDLTLNQIAVMWRQKARTDQIRDGDRNTKYFHTSTVIRRQFNRINALRDQDARWCTDEASIKRIVISHFKNLFSADATDSGFRWPNINGFPAISAHKIQEL